MSDVPYMKLWIGDFARDTAHLSQKEVGQYLLLLMVMWGNDGKLPSDPKRLYRIARGKVSEAVMSFFDDDGQGGITQKRLQKELKKARDLNAKQKQNIEARWNKNKDLPDTTVLPNAYLHSHSHSHSHKKEKEKRVSSGDDSPPTREAFDLYNLKAKTLGLAEARVLTPERSKKLRARLDEHGLPGWKEALAAIERQPFLLGRNNRGWRANLDFLLQPESLNKVREGAYSDDGRPETMQETAARLVRESEEKNGVVLEWMQSLDAGGSVEIRANPGQCLPALSAPGGSRDLSADDG